MHETFGHNLSARVCGGLVQKVAKRIQQEDVSHHVAIYRRNIISERLGFCYRAGLITRRTTDRSGFHTA